MNNITFSLFSEPDHAPLPYSGCYSSQGSGKFNNTKAFIPDTSKTIPHTHMIVMFPVHNDLLFSTRTCKSCTFTSIWHFYPTGCCFHVEGTRLVAENLAIQTLLQKGAIFALASLDISGGSYYLLFLVVKKKTSDAYDHRTEGPHQSLSSMFTQILMESSESSGPVSGSVSQLRLTGCTSL